MSTRVTIAHGFAAALRASGLDRFEAVMSLAAPPSAVTRAVPGRFTTRIELPPPAGAGPDGALYLKRYRGRLRAGSAAHEWRSLHQAAAAGIPCPCPVAFGESGGIFGPRESFLMTAEIPRATQADWWIADRPERRRELVSGVADLARRFHRAGFHHQDFYLCHFFVREAKGDGPPDPLELFLIDFQRCGRLDGHPRAGTCTRRRLVKDLAQLHYSLGVAGFSEADWLALLERYGGVDPSFEHAVRKKSARIARHVPKHG